MPKEAVDQEWNPARLIPTVGIRGQEEQEKRATSTLLAVMRAVPEFGHALLKELGAPKGKISTFAEVRFKDGDGKVSIPDGAIVVERGKTRWCCLVEVKTGAADLTSEQVSRYLDLARENDLHAVVTISNQITPSVTHSPVPVDGRKLRRVSLSHLSWWRVITEAVVQHRFRGISDPDQAWILGELIAYLDHEASGASGFTDMGTEWVKVRDGARAGTLRAADKEVRSVAERWDQFGQYLALGLSQDLGRDVTMARPRSQTYEQRVDALVKSLADAGVMDTSVRVPDTVAPLAIPADLRTRQVHTSVTVDAPKEGRPGARINWLLRQLKDAPDSLRIEARFAGARETSSVLLAEAREYPQRLLSAADPKREPRAFTLTLSRPLGTKRGKAKGSFIHDTRVQAFEFYRELVQNLKAWQAKPPKLRDERDEEIEVPRVEEGVATPPPVDLSEPTAALPAA
jgi:hypothetical protein